MRHFFSSVTRIVLGIIVAVVLLVLIVVGIAVGTAHHAIVKAVAPRPTPTQAAPAPVASTPAPPPSSPAPTTTGPVGTTFVYTGQDDAGNNVSYDVTLTQVDQTAPLGQYDSLSNPADKLVAARITIKGVTGSVSDDANSDASAVGTDTTEYQPSFDDTTAGPNFNDGDWQVGPGQTQTGWVTFEVPKGQNVASIEWTPFDDSSFVTWNVG